MGDENKQQEFSVELLRVYYGRLFPYDSMFDWLSYGNGDDTTGSSQIMDKEFFPKREWSFTIEDDIYIRYQSFKDKSEFIAAIQKRQPHKIDIGAVFSAPPKDHTTIKPELFKTVERELVFDIDMTDYDNIRKCCTGANICRRCWPYMTMAVKVIDERLRADYGFRNILWVYSGRRGVHCWVCDPEARALPNDARSAIVEYLTVQTGISDNSDRNLKSPFLAPVHPMVKRSYAILEPLFEKYIVSETGQGLLATKESYMKVLQSIPNESVRVELFEEWESNSSMKAVQRWQSLKAATTAPPPQASLQNTAKKSKKISYGELESWRLDLVFTHCYPRLDANVSKAQNHLLKSPFCIHPKTGRVCVPIDPKTADDFDPFSVPTVRMLCQEIDTYDKTHSESGESVPDFEKTSMKQALKTFDKTFMNELRSVIRQTFRDKASQVAAMAVDF